MRIIQLDETQTDISTQAHFHPLAIRLYGQRGINATGPTGSEVRQASPPPPKPLLFPFIPPPSPTTLHSSSSHRDTHASSHQASKQQAARPKMSRFSSRKKYRRHECLLFALRRLICAPSVDAHNKAAAAWQHPNLSQSTVQLCRAQRQYEAAASGGLLNPACSSHNHRTLAPIPTSLSNERCRSA